MRLSQFSLAIFVSAFAVVACAEDLNDDEVIVKEDEWKVLDYGDERPILEAVLVIYKENLLVPGRDEHSTIHSTKDARLTKALAKGLNTSWRRANPPPKNVFVGWAPWGELDVQTAKETHTYYLFKQNGIAINKYWSNAGNRCFSWTAAEVIAELFRAAKGQPLPADITPDFRDRTGFRRSETIIQSPEGPGRSTNDVRGTNSSTPESP